MIDDVSAPNPARGSSIVVRRSSLTKRGALAAIRLYQRWVSPTLPSACRYEPSCSRYAYEAIERFGVARGVALGARRLLRCTPLHKGGYDPVPELQPAPRLDHVSHETPVGFR